MKKNVSTLIANTCKTIIVIVNFTYMLEPKEKLGIASKHSKSKHLSVFLNFDSAIGKPDDDAQSSHNSDTRQAFSCESSNSDSDFLSPE